MKKSIFVLLMAALVLCVLFVSCNSEVAPSEGPSKDLVEVSFENNTKGLSATLETFDKENYFWSYAAVKADSTGLISGQTATYNEAGAVPVQDGIGLKDGSNPVKVPGFSQGVWNFMLFGYKTAADRTNKSNLVYSGEAQSVVLKKNGTNTASVTVNPATDGDGYLLIGNISMKEASSASENLVPSTVTITNIDDTPLSPYPDYDSEKGFKLAKGSYKVVVEFSEGSGDSKISYATGFVIATVYPGLTTTVSGDLSELVTYAQFDADQNPDIINTTVGSEAVGYAETMSDMVFSKTVSQKTIKATVPGDSAKKIVEDIAKDVGINISTGNSTINLNLNVDTTEATASTITYDISMEAILKHTIEEVTTTTKRDVPTVESPVVVTIEMQTGLEDVTVKHSGNAMTKASSATGLTDQQYYYDGVNGKLYICTASFSPFAVSYTVPSYVASIGSSLYRTLVEAVAAVPTDNTKTTIVLLKDYTGYGIKVQAGQNIVIDFNDHIYTVDVPVGSQGTETNGFQLLKGSEVLLRNGSLRSNTAKILLQNYCDLTLEDMNLDLHTANKILYVASNNFGSLTVKGNTVIKAPEGQCAFDVWYGMAANEDYDDGVKVVFASDFTGSVEGKVEYGAASRITNDSYVSKASILVEESEETTVPRFDITYARTDKFTNKPNIVLKGGNYKIDNSFDVDGFVADGYVAVSAGEERKQVVPAVAKLNHESTVSYYGSLQDAINAAVDGDTVTLLQNLVVSSSVTIKDKAITLDGGNNKLSSSSINRIIDVLGSELITIKNIDVKGGFDEAIRFNKDGGNINLINSSFESYFKTLHFVDCKNLAINIDNCTSKGVYGYNVNSNHKSLKWHATNSTFGGWNSAGDVFVGDDGFYFENCTFIKAYGYSVCKPYGTSKFINCCFSNEYWNAATNGGLATGLSTPIKLYFNGCKIADGNGQYVSITFEILQSMLNYEITSGSNSGPSTINKQYWYLDDVCVLSPSEPN